MRIQDYNPNLREITERILLGPQAEIQEKLLNINERYRTSLGVTPTFRWKPGTGDKVTKVYENWVMGHTMKYSGIYQFFRRIDNRSWVYSNIKRMLNDVENMCKRMRSQGIKFQDNSELVEEAWSDIKDSIASQLEEAHDLWPHTDMMITTEVINTSESTQEYDKLRIDFLMSNSVMKIIHSGQEIAELKLYPTSVTFEYTLLDLLQNKCSTSRSNNNNSYGRSHATGEYLHPGGLYHPYIPTYNGNDGRHAVCLGSMQGDIISSMKDLNLVGTAIHLLNWNSRFDVQHTHPHNPPWKAIYGIPHWVSKSLNDHEAYDSYTALYRPETLTNQCGVVNALDSLTDHEAREYAIINDNTCNNIRCELRGECNYYQNVREIDEDRLNNIVDLNPDISPYGAAFLYRNHTDKHTRDELNSILFDERADEELDAQVEAHNENLTYDPEEAARIWLERNIRERNRR